MMRWIVGTSLKLRVLVVAVAAGLLALGVVQLKHTEVDVFPEFAPPRVEVQTACIGLSAAEVESLVTIPLEQAFHGLPHLAEMRSKSIGDLSSINLIFEQGADELEARQLVTERLATVNTTLPTWAAPPVMLPPVSSTSRVLKIGVTSDTRSLIDLSMISYWKVRSRLLQVPGVANVAIWGERLQMLQVQAEPAKMRERHVSLEEIKEATADALDAGLLKYADGARIGTGGWLQTDNQTLTVRHILPIVTPADLAKVTVSDVSGKPVLLGDVAQVVEEHQPLFGDAVINDGPGLMLVVQKFPWGNTLDVTRGVEDALDQMRPGLSGITFDTTIFRPATFIESAIHNLTSALLLGCLLVVLVLAAFLFEWRTALISLVAIPLSLVAAVLTLRWLGYTVNTMVLAGLVIAVGVVVDDAIIDIENIMRRLREHRRAGGDRSISTTAGIILEASLEVRSPIIYATLIIVAAALPIFFLQGLTSSFFKPLMLAYTLSVLVSMVVALTVTPALALILLRKAPLERRGSPLVRVLQRWYTGGLRSIIGRPRWAYAIVGIIVAAGLAVLPGLGQDLFPTFKERNFLIHWIAPPGTSATEESRIVTQLSKELRAVPGVRNFGSHIGQAFLGDEPNGVNFGENWISIDPDVDYDETLEKIEEVVQGYPGMYRDTQTYLKERIGEVLSGSGHAIVVRVYGDDLHVMRQKADEIRDILGGIRGVTEANTALQQDVAQIVVTVDLAKAQKLGIKPGDVRRAAAVIVSGEEVGDVYRDGKTYDVAVWSTPATRSSVNAIRQLPIDLPGGGQVPLGDVATVVVAPTPNYVEHDANQRKIDVEADVAGRDLGSVVGDLEEKLADVDFPHGYRAEIFGEFTERQAAQRRLLLFSVGALIAIFVLLQLSYRDWRLAVLSFVTLPSALVGGVLAVYAIGGVVSLGALVGFFTVLGIAARNGILLINHYQHLERHEGMTFGEDLVLRGSRERLSPILMTTLATGLALVPLVIGGNLPGREIEHPMAAVIVGGLITSTLLNLFVLPALYLRFGRPRQPAATQGLPEPA
jgi:CzcA family heavy metal efflux pump